MKHLLKNWKNIQTRIREARTLFLFLDYDGTLTPIVSQPNLAHCPPQVKDHLFALRGLPGVHIAIISGRSLKDLQEKVGLSGIIYVGNHGLEIEDPYRSHKKNLPSFRTKELKRITQNLQNSLKDFPKILFEDKGPILSIHYRNVPQKFFTQISHILKKELQQWGDHWKTTAGKMVFEIQPNIDFHKGKAVREILNHFPSQGLLPIYLGDDQTDEEAFRELKDIGIAVFVGSENTLSGADFFLRNHEEVQEFLLRCRWIRTHQNE